MDDRGRYRRRHDPLSSLAVRPELQGPCIRGRVRTRGLQVLLLPPLPLRSGRVGAAAPRLGPTHTASGPGVRLRGQEWMGAERLLRTGEDVEDGRGRPARVRMVEAAVVRAS